LIYLQWYVLVFALKTCCLYVLWETQDQIWGKIFCIPKNMNSRTPMSPRNVILWVIGT